MMKWIEDNGILTGSGAATIALFGIWLTWFLGGRTAYWHRRKAQVDAAIDRINREEPNLRHIAAGKPYSGKLQQKTVEETSFELLQPALSPLKEYWRYRRRVRSILAEIARVEQQSAKSVDRLIPLIDSLKGRLLLDPALRMSAK